MNTKTVLISVLLVIATAAPTDKTAETSKSNLPSRHVDGEIQCDEKALKCTISCGLSEKTQCEAHTHENQFRSKMHGYMLKCDESDCSLRCTENANQCAFTGTRKFKQMFLDDGETDFGQALDGAAKFITDITSGFSKDSF